MLRITELDFLSIRNNLKEYLKSQSEFMDYDFEGSGMAILLDVLSYNTHYNSYYLNMVGNEMFLDTAQLRASVISHAKHIGYVPVSQKGAVTTINLVVTPEDDNEYPGTTLTLPKYSRFISQTLDAGNFVFSTTEAHYSTKLNGSFRFDNLVLTQGEPVEHRYLVSSDLSTKYTIPSSNVDISTLEVSVQESSSNTSLTNYTLMEDLTEVGSNTNIFFLEESSVGNYTLYFGDNVIGHRPSNGNIIIVNYLDSVGTLANKANAFTSISSIEGISNVIVESVSAASGGSPKQSIESVRYTAPYYYTTQNRAVTKTDYETLLLKDYPNIEAISVWPGDENDPPIYGKVFISLKPKENYVLTLKDKQRIVEEIIANRSVLTVTPEIIDPDYMFLLLNAKVSYKESETSLDENQMKALVRQAILDYNETELNTFNSVFRQSRLQQYIDAAHPSILGSTVNLNVQKRVEITPGQVKSYSTNFGLRLFRGVVDNKFSTHPSIFVRDAQNITREIYIEDTPNSFTGVDGVSILNPGSGYTSAPTVIISGDGVGATAVATVLRGQINTVTITNRGSDYTTASISFVGGGGTGAVASLQVQSKIGTLRSFYYQPNGEKVVVNPNIGTLDYLTGKLNLDALGAITISTSSRYDENIVAFNAVPYEGLIEPSKNRIVSIDEYDSASIQITMVPR